MSTIDFLLIVALEEERDALLAKLPGYRQVPASSEDVRTYYEVDLPTHFPDGSTGTYHLIISLLLGMGRVNAATLTGDAIRRWNPRYVLLIGIAGGISEAGVGLGDVIISDQVIDYELQKITTSVPSIRYSVHRADPRLQGRAQSLNVDEWHSLIIEKRPKRGSSKATIGPIATGDKVIAFDEVLNQHRASWPKLIGVEMEAGGVASAAFQSAYSPGFFMVRGVSDLADNKKDTASVGRWRKYACDVAASFAVALLRNGAIPISELKRTDSTYRRDIEDKPIDQVDSQGISRNFHKTCNEYESIKALARNYIDRQLAGPHLALKYSPNRYIARATEGEIYSWLCDNNRTSISNCFLIIASAGCGKTNMLCHLSSQMAEKGLTFLFPGTLLRFDVQAGLWSLLRDVISGIQQLGASRHELRKFFIDFASKNQNGIVIILDAINEYHAPLDLKRELYTFFDEIRGTRIKIVISCRDYYWGLFDAEWWSEFLKSSLGDKEKKLNRRVLGNFTHDEAEQAFKVYFSEFNISAQPEGNALDQLRHPLLLRFFCETYKGQHVGGLKDIRLKNLFDHYWTTKLSSIAGRMMDQGYIGVTSEIARHIGQGILGVASYMLEVNRRLIPAPEAQRITHSLGTASFLNSPYGRILDEHIILEEFIDRRDDIDPMVAFVFEEFMEYAMAKSIATRYLNLSLDQLSNSIVELTNKYSDFSQVFGVVLYLALMLKEERNLGLWPVLIGLGERWERLVIEAFRKLPTDQIDDGVFDAIIELLKLPNKFVQNEAIELLKYGRLKRIPPPELIEAVGNLVTHSDLSVRRRAILALGSCPGAYAIPLIRRAIEDNFWREKDISIISRNAMMALAKIGTYDAVELMARIKGMFGWRAYRSDLPIETLGANTRLFLKLLEHDDPIVRLGAISLVGDSELRDGLPILESMLTRIQDSNQSDNQTPYHFYIRRTTEVRPGNFIREIKDALKSLRETIARMDVDDTWRSKIMSCTSVDDYVGLPYEAKGLSPYKNTKLIIHIMKSGLEYRSKRKWSVTGYWEQIKISAPKSRLINGKMSDDDIKELQRLLSTTVNSSEKIIGNGSRQRDYYIEYIYRSWGVEPEIVGYTEPFYD